MFAIQPGKAGQLLNEFGKYFSEVKAVLVISPHWITEGLEVTALESLETIHDFYGFPDLLYQLGYDAPGSRGIAIEIKEHLAAQRYIVGLNGSRGRDHGAWVPMMHLLPEMMQPVLQLSLDKTMSPTDLIKLGESLIEIRDQGIAIIASGSITHNLYDLKAYRAPVLPYAERFQNWVRARVVDRNIEHLSFPDKFTSDFKRAHPTNEHYVTLLLAMGASDEKDTLTIIEGGILYGAGSMESYGWFNHLG
ncbi:MAG: dioxygenase [Neptuniibacter sp.]